jgi:hypothetical protein
LPRVSLRVITSSIETFSSRSIVSRTFHKAYGFHWVKLGPVGQLSELLSTIP